MSTLVTWAHATRFKPPGSFNPNGYLAGDSAGGVVAVQSESTAFPLQSSIGWSQEYPQSTKGARRMPVHSFV